MCMIYTFCMFVYAARQGKLAHWPVSSTRPDSIFKNPKFFPVIQASFSKYSHPRRIGDEGAEVDETSDGGATPAHGGHQDSEHQQRHVVHAGAVGDHVCLD